MFVSSSPPVAPLLAIFDLGSLPAGADTAKWFETDVAPVFGACAKTWSIQPCSARRGMRKKCPTEIKEKRFLEKMTPHFKEKLPVNFVYKWSLDNRTSVSYNSAHKRCFSLCP